MKGVNASITVYLSLTLVLILSVILTMLEGCRVRAMRTEADRITDTAVMSLFAEYDRDLLSEYDLLMLDGGYGGEFDIQNVDNRLERFIYENCRMDELEGIRADFFSMALNSGEITQYRLATDSNGAAYYKMACEYMKAKLAADAIQSLYGWINNDYAGDEDGLSGLIEDGLDAKDSLSSDEAYGDEKNSSVTKSEEKKAKKVSDETKGILEYVKEISIGGILEYLADGKISDKSIELSQTASKRQLNEGNMQTSSKSSGWEDKLLFESYLGDKLSLYTQPGENCALDYEMEYCYAGCAGDRDNLKKTAEALLVMRELANYAYIVTDTDKKEEARIVAIAIAGVMALPAVILAIQYGILAAWAFLESVNDVRILLSGGKVPPVKSKDTWNTSLGSVKKSSDNVSETEGLDYKTYLYILLFTKNTDVLVMRSIDMIEQDIRLCDGRSEFCMDGAIAAVSWSAYYTLNTMFFNFFNILDEDRQNGYSCLSEGSYSYK